MEEEEGEDEEEEDFTPEVQINLNVTFVYSNKEQGILVGCGKFVGLKRTLQS